jgi:predicted enzyme related to lactoylglutathione lyase
MTRQAKLVQFAIHARDPEQAAAFYRAVFGWQISRFAAPEKYGLPAHLIIENAGNGDAVLKGHIETRTESEPVVTGFECTIAVESVESIAAAVRANGGKVLRHVAFEPEIGGLVRFTDPDGNVVLAFQFPPDE